MSSILSAADKGETKRKQALITTSLQNAFLDWLVLPDTYHQLDSILASVLAENSLINDKAAPSPNITGSGGAASPPTTYGDNVNPSSRLIERSRVLSPVATDYDFVSAMDRLPPSPAPDIGSPQKMSSTVSEDLETTKARDSTTTMASTSVLNVVDMGSSTESFKEGEIPRFWFPARSRRPPTVGQKDSWNEQVAEVHWNIFDPTGVRRKDDPSTIWITFSTFEMKIVKEVLKLSRYMACCILCMINGGNLEEDLAKCIASATSGVTGATQQSAESMDGSSVSPRSETQTEQPVLSLAKWKDFWTSKQLTLDNDIWNFFCHCKGRCT